ncbi:MAG: PqqD family protein [Prevotella sp.]|nr:PqqD family protein [Prevotella sp.]
MKAKPGFNLREVCGEQIIVAEGKENIDFSNIISMNESSAYLWKAIQGKEFTVDDLTKLLLEQYEVDETTAHEDAETLAAQWGKAEIIEGDDIPQKEVQVVKPREQAIEEKKLTERKGFFKRLFGK